VEFQGAAPAHLQRLPTVWPRKSVSLAAPALPFPPSVRADAPSPGALLHAPSPLPAHTRFLRLPKGDRGAELVRALHPHTGSASQMVTWGPQLGPKEPEITAGRTPAPPACGELVPLAVHASISDAVASPVHRSAPGSRHLSQTTLSRVEEADEEEWEEEVRSALSHA